MISRRSLLGMFAAIPVLGGASLLLPRSGGMSGLSGIGAANAQTAADIDTSGVFEGVLGDENAPVTVVEYSSFTCPHCKNFHTDILPSLKRDYVETGKVKFVFREVYFDRFGLWAGMVARCGGGDRYFPMVDLIFDGQRELFSASDPAVVVDNLRRLGRTAGLSDAELDACLSDGDMAQTLVAHYQKTAGADEINATPTLVINGTKHSNMSYSKLQKVLDDELGS